METKVSAYELAMLAVAIDRSGELKPSEAVSCAWDYLEAAAKSLAPVGEVMPVEESPKKGGAESPEQRRGAMTSDSMKSALYG